MTRSRLVLKRLFRFSPAAALVCFLAGVAYTGDVYVGLHGYVNDYANTHYYQDNESLDPSDPDFGMLWALPINAIGRGCLFAINDTIYIRGQYGNITCAKDGELIWRRNYNGLYRANGSVNSEKSSTTSGMCYYNGNLYYAERKIEAEPSTDTVFKTNARTGELLAKKHFPGTAKFKRNGYYAPVAYKGYVYGFMNDTLWRLDTAFDSFSFVTLDYNFIYASGMAVDTVHDKLYFVGYKWSTSKDDIMHRVDLGTFKLDYAKEIKGCKHAWQFQSAVQIISPDTLFFGNGYKYHSQKGNSRVYVLDARDGSVIKHINPSNFHGSRAGIIGPDFIGIVDRKNSVWLLRRSDFEPFSTSPISSTADMGSTCGSASASNDFIFKIGGQHLNASDIAGAKTGNAKKVFSHNVGSSNNCVMGLPHNNKLYYHGGAGIIWCFGKKSK